ncbi:MAG: ubiquitin carboxyl-terminal hydrolase, partial [Parachlamydiales bacterium]|nr:ubiquitin carboxyl-terminal hydrolase [Parachlamydiales bacterium]
MAIRSTSSATSPDAPRQRPREAEDATIHSKDSFQPRRWHQKFGDGIKAGAKSAWQQIWDGEGPSYVDLPGKVWNAAAKGFEGKEHEEVRRAMSFSQTSAAEAKTGRELSASPAGQFQMSIGDDRKFNFSLKKETNGKTGYYKPDDTQIKELEKTVKELLAKNGYDTEEKLKKIQKVSLNFELDSNGAIDPTKPIQLIIKETGKEEKEIFSTPLESIKDETSQAKIKSIVEFFNNKKFEIIDDKTGLPIPESSSTSKTEPKDEDYSNEANSCWSYALGNFLEAKAGKLPTDEKDEMRKRAREIRTKAKLTPGAQHDPHEALSMLGELDGDKVAIETTRKYRKGLIPGLKTDELTDPKSEEEPPMFTLPFPSGAQSMQDLIDSDFHNTSPEGTFAPSDEKSVIGRNERLKRYACEKLGIQLEKTTGAISWPIVAEDKRFEKAPPYIITSVRRTEYDSASQKNIKLKTPIKVTDKVVLKAGQHIKVAADMDAKAEVPYDLAAFIEHIGDSADSGHYVTYVRDKDGKWYLYDDRAPQYKQEVKSHLAAEAYQRSSMFLYNKRQDAAVQPAGQSLQAVEEIM